MGSLRWSKVSIIKKVFWPFPCSLASQRSLVHFMAFSFLCIWVRPTSGIKKMGSLGRQEETRPKCSYHSRATRNRNVSEGGVKGTIASDAASITSLIQLSLRCRIGKQEIMAAQSVVMGMLVWAALNCNVLFITARCEGSDQEFTTATPAPFGRAV